VADELARWAAERAPGLLARAEADAVAILRDALVGGVLRQRERGTTPSGMVPRPEVVAESERESGEVLWTYCVLTADEPVPASLAGVVASNPVERVDAGDLTALVSRVPLSEFGEEPLRRNLNDLDWLERVARGHEAVLERTLHGATIVPLRLCTIFGNEQGVRRMLDEQRLAFTAALEVLRGHQEWGVKLLADREALEAAARARSPEADALADELDTQSAGGAYMLRRRLERQVREAADELAVGVADDVHARLQAAASDAVLNPPQNRDLSGHEGEMLLNGAYLVETPKLGRLRELVDELQDRHRGLGVRLELTGPWPPYNFIPRDAATAGTALA
jgi:Gas vesicle synthesis protein GvpL/GvpF